MIYLNVCLPTSGQCRAEHTLSLANFGMYFMQVPVFPGQEQRIVFRQIQSSCISFNREKLVADSLAEGATHILFVDEDIGFDPDVPHGLLQRQLPFVVGNYRIRFEGMPFAAIRPDGMERIATTADSPDLEECGACGFGMALIAREVFEAVPQPWFPQQWMPDTKTYTTEDTPFYLAAREHGIIPMIDHVASRKLIHVGSYRYRWNDPTSLTIP